MHRKFIQQRKFKNIKNHKVKKTILASALLALSMTAMAQQDDKLTAAELAETEENAVAIDTVPTRDKYTKIVLYQNYTWAYIELDRPNISDEDFEEDWQSEQIHAYPDVTIESLPDSVDLCLTDSLHGWCCPKVGAINSSWKFRKTRPHKGTDIDLEIGDTIRAAFDGKVRVVREVGKAGGYGNLVVLRHPNGLETYYAHLSKHLVAENDLVKAGEPIALGGNTGRSTGPHLHFEVRYMGKPFDAERIFDFPNGKLRQEVFTLKKHYFNIYSHYGMSERQSAQATEAVFHKVRAGENLGVIARKYHTTVTKICNLNHIRSTKTLQIGQRLRVR